MTSIVAATGIASPRPCLHTLFDRAKARGCTSGPDDQASGQLIDLRTSTGEGATSTASARARSRWSFEAQRQRCRTGILTGLCGPWCAGAPTSQSPLMDSGYRDLATGR